MKSTQSEISKSWEQRNDALGILSSANYIINGTELTRPMEVKYYVANNHIRVLIDSKNFFDFINKLSRECERVLWNFTWVDQAIDNKIKNKAGFQELLDLYILLSGYLDYGIREWKEYEQKRRSDLQEIPPETVMEKKRRFAASCGFQIEMAQTEDDLIIHLTGIDSKIRRKRKIRFDQFMDEFAVTYLTEAAFREGSTNEKQLNRYIPSDQSELVLLTIRILHLYGEALLEWDPCSSLAAENTQADDEKQAETDAADEGKALQEELSILREMARESAKTIDDSDKEIQKLKDALAKAEKVKNSAILEEQRNAAKWRKKYAAAQEELDNLKQKIASQDTEMEGTENITEDEMSVSVAVPDENGVYSYKNILMVGGEFISRLQTLRAAFPNLRVEEKPIQLNKTNTDICIIMSAHSGHAYSEGFKKQCESLGIPFAYTAYTNPDRIAADVARQNIQL